MVSPRLLLHLEGAAVLTAACIAYAALEGSWLLFGILLFAPDLSMLGYLAGNRVGAVCYNLAHTYAVPVLIAAVLWLAGVPLFHPLFLIWIAHIGLDRMLGYGLKYPSHFRDTHLQRL